MNLLYPRFSRRDLAAMLRIAAVGAAIAGVYGIVHDQVTYSISPEYFTRIKFHQFAYANFGLAERVFVAEIGFLATWWVGLMAAWLLARTALPDQPRSVALSQVRCGFVMVFSAAMAAGTLGYLLGVWRGPHADYSGWQLTAEWFGITDVWSFVRVAYIHNAGYLGAVVGLIAALLHVGRQKHRYAAAADSADALRVVQ